jgi:PAS domain S-box-containing protein
VPLHKKIYPIVLNYFYFKKRIFRCNDFSVLPNYRDTRNEFSLLACLLNDAVYTNSKSARERLKTGQVMLAEDIFEHGPQAQILVAPFDNKVLAANIKARQLFLLSDVVDDTITVTSLFRDCLPELYTLSSAAIHHGWAWSENLFFSAPGDSAPLETMVSVSKIQEKTYLIFSFNDSIELFRLRHKSSAERHHHGGFLHWTNAETVFEDIERQNQLLLSAVGDGIYGVDVNGCTTFVNPAAEIMLGWSKSELVGRNIHDMIHHTHEDGSDYHPGDCPIYAAFHDGSVHSVDDEVFWSQSGKPIPVEYTSTPVTDNGCLVGAVVIFRDITERKRTEKKLLNAMREVDSLKQRLELENAYLQEEIKADFNHHQIIGQSAAVQRMVNQIELVAPTNANVLITGESGTGKELIARAIHEASARKARPLIRVNCAAIPAELFESEFFGHVKGAFSGAISNRAGRFELADGATIFLDEVAEIPLQLQGKLLRVLQEQQFERVGDSKTCSVDVRVIAATNQNLKSQVEKGKFREDLFYRLNVFPIESPALKERLEDLPMLTKYFIKKVCSRSNKSLPMVSLAQLEHLKSYHWPGNIRELENIIERQVILSNDNRLHFDFLSTVISKQTPHTSHPVINPTNEVQKIKLDISSIELALKQTGGRIYGANGAATILGLKPTTLASRIKKYEIKMHLFRT